MEWQCGLQPGNISGGLGNGLSHEEGVAAHPQKPSVTVFFKRFPGIALEFTAVGFFAVGREVHGFHSNAHLSTDSTRGTMMPSLPRSMAREIRG